MHKIRINKVGNTDDSYDIVIGKDLFGNIADSLKKVGFKKIAIITDSSLKGVYGSVLLKSLKQKNLDALMISFNAEKKNRNSKAKIEDVLLENNFPKNSLLIALGGGSVAEMTGFVASTFKQGISYITVPTTLKAMVDNSVGGSTGVVASEKGDIIGSIYHPKRVFIDLNTLRTLPKEEMKNGIVHMLQHSITADKNFFVFLSDYHEHILKLDEAILLKAINQSCSIKEVLVNGNLGYTIERALRQIKKVKHSNLFSLGIVSEVKIAQELGMLNDFHSAQIVEFLEKIGFGTKANLPARDIISKTNKVYTLPKKIGEVEQTAVHDDIVAKVLTNLK